MVASCGKVSRPGIKNDQRNEVSGSRSRARARTLVFNGIVGTRSVRSHDLSFQQHGALANHNLALLRWSNEVDCSRPFSESTHTSRTPRGSNSTQDSSCPTTPSTFGVLHVLGSIGTYVHSGNTILPRWTPAELTTCSSRGPFNTCVCARHDGDDGDDPEFLPVSHWKVQMQYERCSNRARAYGQLKRDLLSIAHFCAMG